MVRPSAHSWEIACRRSSSSALDGAQRVVDANVGESVMAAAVRNGIPGIIGECGGNCSCATCHVYVDDEFSASVGGAKDMEDDLLDLGVADRRDTSRLSCQIKVTEDLDGLTVQYPRSSDRGRGHTDCGRQPGRSAARGVAARRRVRPGRSLWSARSRTLPYQRPPLSKAYLQGSAELEQLWLRAPEVLDRAAIFRLSRANGSRRSQLYRGVRQDRRAQRVAKC